MHVPGLLTGAALALSALSALSATTSAYEFLNVASNDTNARVGADAPAVFKVSTTGAMNEGGYAVGSTVDVNAQDYAITTACKAQSWTITQKKASSVYLQFSSVSLPEGDSLVAVSANGKEVKVEPSTDGGDTITSPVPGSTISLQYRPSPSCASSSPASFSLQKIGVRFTNEWLVTKEAVCGANTMENVKCFANSNAGDDKKMYDQSKAVLRTQRVRPDGKIVVCTAWLWGNKGHLVTNNHCFSSQGMVDAAQFDFGVEAASCDIKCQPGSCPIAKSIKGKGGVRFLGADAQLDIALLQIQGNAASEIVGSFGYLRILFGTPSVGDQIYIPQHPGGGARQIAKTDDDSNKSLATVKTVGTSIDVEGTVYTGLMGYSADTESGSSGSPVIARKNNLVVGLHRIGYCNNAATPSKSLLGFLVPLGKANDGVFA